MVGVLVNGNSNSLTLANLNNGQTYTVSIASTVSVSLLSVTTETLPVDLGKLQTLIMAKARCLCLIHFKLCAYLFCSSIPITSPQFISKSYTYNNHHHW